MIETIIVIGIVAIVAVMAGRSFYHTMAGKNDGCGCAGGCQGCTCKDSIKLDCQSSSSSSPDCQCTGLYRNALPADRSRNVFQPQAQSLGASIPKSR